MKRFILLFILLIGFSSSYSQFSKNCSQKKVVVTNDGVCDSNPYYLVFEDNFDGNSLDLTKWQLQVWRQGALNTNKEQEYNSLNNVEVSNGTCKIIAKQENVIKPAVSWLPDNEILSDGQPNLRSYAYTSSNLWSNYKFGYGVYEIRCKIPEGKGFWPAFWMFGENSEGVKNEIDVFEFWDNKPKKHHMNVHYDNNHCPTTNVGPNFSENFHKFTLVWDRYIVAWYVDGDLKRISSKYTNLLGQTVGCNSLIAWQFYLMDLLFPKNKMQIIFNLAIQKGSKAPDNTTILPNALEVDYIRYYKQIPCLGNITINSISQLNLQADEYNVIVGNNITINSSAIIHNGQQLELIASNEITIEPGFTVENGAVFIAKIDPTACQSSSGIITSSNHIDKLNEQILNFQKDNPDLGLEATSSDSNTSIDIYPNPTNGNIVVEINDANLKDCVIHIKDELGRLLLEKSGIHGVNTIDLSQLNKGVYFIEIIDKNTLNNFTTKIIYQ